MKRLRRASHARGVAGPTAASSGLGPRGSALSACVSALAAGPRCHGGTSPESVTRSRRHRVADDARVGGVRGSSRWRYPDRRPSAGSPARSVKLTYGSLPSGHVRPASLLSRPRRRSSSRRCERSAISVSPSPRFINRTPLVCRPALRTWRAAVRMTPPPEVMAYSSVSSSTINAPTRLPRLRSYWIVRMPLPPRPWTGVLLDGGALGVAAGGRDQQIRALAARRSATAARPRR